MPQSRDLRSTPEGGTADSSEKEKSLLREYNNSNTVDTVQPMPCAVSHRINAPRRTGTSKPRHLGDDQGKSDSALITVCVGPMLGLAALKSAQSL